MTPRHGTPASTPGSEEVLVGSEGDGGEPASASGDEMMRSSGDELPQDAVDFCERLADVAALQYSRHLLQFANDYDVSSGAVSLGGGTSAGSSSTPEFSALCDVFCTALRRRFLESEAMSVVDGERPAGTSLRATLSRPATACGGMVHTTKMTTPTPPRRRVSRSQSPPVAERHHQHRHQPQHHEHSGTKLRRSITKRIPSFLRGNKRSDSTSSASGSSSAWPSHLGASSSSKQQRKALKKESVLHQLVDVPVEGGDIQWAKCRVVLKQDSSGHVISFYSPPKAAKPRSGVLCFLITEVRPTTPLELPDCRHSFVVKGINGMEYVLDCSSREDMLSWVSTIKACSRLDNLKRPAGRSSIALDAPTPAAENDYDEAEGSSSLDRMERRHTISSPSRVSLAVRHSNSSGSVVSRKSSSASAGSSGGGGGGVVGGVVGGGPFHGRNSGARLSTTSLPAIRALSNLQPSAVPPPTLLSQAHQPAGKDDAFMLPGSLDSALSDSFLQSPDEVPMISRYVEGTPSSSRRSSRTNSSSGGTVAPATCVAAQPWFHGQLSRQEAAALVCHGGLVSHGTFLVRESESREGVMVLTFNCQGRAKHLRLNMQADKTVKVQQWQFDDIFHAIDYFKIHPVPLECVTDNEVYLLNYVVAASSTRASSILEEAVDPGTTVTTKGTDPPRTLDLPGAEGDTPKMMYTPQKAPISDIAEQPQQESWYVNAMHLRGQNAADPVVDLPPEEDLKPVVCPGQGTLRGAPEPGRPRTYFIDGTGFHARNSYVVAN